MHTTPTTTRSEHHDLVVCGGGLAGFTAAVSAARLGITVCLVQDRPVLGGNSSSEVRVVPRGSTTYHAWAREGGVLAEAMVGERARNHEPIFENGWTNSVWDLELYDICQRTPGLTLHLNTVVEGVTVEDGSITTVHCWTPSAETRIDISGRTFLDATGDGVVAFRAGCEIRQGTEGFEEFGEPHAPAQATDEVMGNSLHFKTKDVGRPVEYQLPEWAHSYDDPDFFYTGGRRPHDVRGGFWWIELGTPWDTIADAEVLRHELTRHTLGVWDWMKNKDPALRGKVENLALDWIGQVPGKRESRRIMGLHLMTEHDLLDEEGPADEVAYGGWNIDLHTPGGLLAATSEPTAAEGYVLTGQASSRAYVGPFGIPLRSLIAKDVDNLLMAGRNVSATHVALGSVRVQSTTALMGQAAGTAAALALRHDVPLHKVPVDLIGEVQQQLLRDGVHLPHVLPADDADLARRATASATSSCLFEGAGPEDRWPDAGLGEHRRFAVDDLPQRRGQWLPVEVGPDAAGLRQVSVLLRNRTDRTREVAAHLVDVRHVWDYRVDPATVLASTTLRVPPGEHWVSWPVDLDPQRVQRGADGPVSYLRLDLEAVEDVEWPRAGRVLPGSVSAFEMAPGRMRRYDDGVTMSVRVEPAQRVHPAGAAVSGAARPGAAPNLWLSGADDPAPALTLEWPEPVRLGSLRVTFPGHQLREYDRTPPLWKDPQVARDYDVEVLGRDGGWQPALRVRDNIQPHRVHRLDSPVTTTALRLRVLSTHGDPCAGVHELRCYAPEEDRAELD
ncbi:FAD-dependent oxidoreductase [Auraticoccus sp. F435]|uniref:FAD-dependent oxidoreductase n=1 Tax=Auraticoccus cholistanensis TaxID=2656650 RepID=A0A6A9USB0_9ACTN|nr:FAD-dependent oxidoreductase [Auraticoccus cholistanensis]MVA75488.1 FAD-dependent oxidoreductase [Auraticoccus cholistanensis]